MGSSQEYPHSRRAVVTGVGPVTAVGIGRDAFWHGLRAERSPIARVTRFDPGDCRARHAAEIHGFNAGQWFGSRETKRWDRYTQLAMVSAQLALEDAGLALGKGQPQPRIGVSFGSALGGIADAEAEHSAYLERGMKAVSRSLALQIFGGSAHGNISITYGLQGPATTHSNSCASGNVALGDALRAIRLGLADVMIAGAAEAPLSALTFTAFDLIYTMSRWQGEPAEVACRPFDGQRDGFVMGEGAASLIVESYEHAVQRGAHIYGELLGYGQTSEAWHMTAPRPDGEPLRRAMLMAMEDAGVRPEEIDYVNAHASATPQNDANEAQQIATVFDNKLPLVSGTKPYTGHPLGAAGAIEAVICLLAMEHQWAPPTLHLEQQDENCPVDCIPQKGRETLLHTVMNNSFGFGGVDTALVLRKL